MQQATCKHALTMLCPCNLIFQVWGKTGSKLYGPASGADYVDNHKRFTLFCKAAIESTRALPFGFGEDCVFVANDWHSAMVPVLLKDVYQPQGQFTKSKVALCIHNIAFQVRMQALAAGHPALETPTRVGAGCGHALLQTSCPHASPLRAPLARTPLEPHPCQSSMLSCLLSRLTSSSPPPSLHTGPHVGGQLQGHGPARVLL